MRLALIQLDGQNISAHAQTAEHIYSLVEKTCETGADLVLLPECAFPAYFIGMAADDKWKDGVHIFLNRISELAAKYNTYIVTGIAFPDGESLYNSLFAYNRKGEMICRTDKSNLWHFDSMWFTAGKEYKTFETEFGTIGVMVCADGRIPEITRILRLKGAKLILDTVNLVSSAATPKQLFNQQYNFLLKTRSKENGLFIAACNKCGVEDSAVTMMGRSIVTSPDGAIIAEASPDKEEVIFCDVDLSFEHKQLNRKPELYGIITQPTNTLPVYEDIKCAYKLNELECYTAAIRFDANSKDDYIAKAKLQLDTCQKLGAEIIILPPSDITTAGNIQNELSSIMSQETILIFPTSDSNGRKTFIIKNDQANQCIEETHSSDKSNKCEIKVITLRSGLKISALFGKEMDIPEIARVSMLNGADIILWIDEAGNENYLPTMQTRAAENKVFVVRTTKCDTEDFSCIVNPDGVVVCSTFASKNHTTAGMIYTALSKFKCVIPGTDIVESRIPSAYKELTL